MMSPPLRKFVLTLHLIFSLGWFGAVVVFLVHAIAGLTSQDEQIVRAAYLAMGLSIWFVIVPSNIGSLITGVVQSLGTQWGLVKHYWVATKFFLTAVITVLLFVHAQPVSTLASLVSERSLDVAEFRGLRVQLVFDAAAALAALLAATILSVYKPWGLTPYGLRTLNEQSASPVLRAMGRTTWSAYVLAGLIILVALFIILHIRGSGFGHH